MIVEILFTKVSGAGNDFVIIDNRNNHLPANGAALAQRLCSRHFGVGADGLLLLEKSSSAHFAMKYFNSDGSYGGMCGNGGRCIARYAFINKIAPKEMSFEALDYIYHAEILTDGVSLTMKDPSDFKAGLKVNAAGRIHHGLFVNTGSPHFVEFTENIDSIQVKNDGRAIRESPLFAPEGTNVNFVEVTGPDSIRLRTYERGVEAETLACGTGAVASGIISYVQRAIEFPVAIEVKGGEILKVTATVTESGRITLPRLEGSAHILFTGKLLYDTENCAVVDFIQNI